MKKIYSQCFSLTAVGISMLAIGCDGNKKNTQNSLPAYSNHHANASSISVYPTRGSILGGYSITIYSSKVASGDRVTLDGVNCPVSHTGTSSLGCTVPPSSRQGSVDVVVTHSNGQSERLSSGFTYVASAPSIHNIHLSSRNISRQIRMDIYGSDFDSNAEIRVGDTLCRDVTITSSSQISCDIAPNVLRADQDTFVRLINPDGGSARYSEPLRFTLSNPTINSTIPEVLQLNQNTPISINGSDFFPGARVRIDGNDCYPIRVDSENNISCLAPPSRIAHYATLTVTNMDGRSANLVIRYGNPAVPPAPRAAIPGQPNANRPEIQSIHPANGSSLGGTEITLQGRGFSLNSRVYIGDMQQTITQATADRIVLTTTATPKLGARDVRVVNPGNREGVMANGFTYVNQPDPALRARYRDEAEARIQQRPVLAETDDANDFWARTVIETAMTRASTRRMLQSANALDRRYSQAVSNAEAALGEVHAMAQRLNLGNSVKKRQMKEAALRFLDRVKTDFINDAGLDYPYPIRRYSRNAYTLLTVQQSIALAWYAINDATIYTTEMEREDRKRGMVEAFAFIQRAHNDHGPNDTIIWDQARERDQPSCEPGTYKRIFEHLDNVHPDVTINEVVNFDADHAGVAAVPTRAEVTTDIRQRNAALFPAYWEGLSQEQQQALREAVEAYDDNVVTLEVYTTYLQQLRNAVRTASPGIPADMLEAETNVNMMCALINETLP